MSTPLTGHLRAWLGDWPLADGQGRSIVGDDHGAGRGVVVVPSARRDEPGWDGSVRPLRGALRPDGTAVVVVSPSVHGEVAGLLADRPVAALDDPGRRAAVGEAVAGAGARLGLGVLRWIARDDDDGVDPSVPALGSWLEHTDPRVPAWLHPFGGEALVALDDEGAYAAGVGVKRHDRTGHELSVVTDEPHRGRGLARRLVATAARSELTRVPVVTYLHAPDNIASARVADAVGFRDRGWRIIGVFGGEARA